MDRSQGVRGLKRYGKLGWFLLAVVIVGVVSWVACAIWYLSSGAYQRVSPSYTGSLPFSERQSAAQYHEETVPVLEEFYDLVSEKSGVELETSTDYYANPDCNEGKFTGVNVQGRGYSAGSGVSLESVLEASEETLSLAGFEGPSVEDNDGSYSLYWEEKENGGYVRMQLAPAMGMSSSSVSGCRPNK